MAKQTFTTGQVLTAAQMTSLQQTAMGGGSATAKTASYVLVAADAGTTVAMNAAGATTITVNTALFAAGDTVLIQNLGAGTCTITAGTATVSTAGSLALVQYEAGILYFTATGAAIFNDYVQAGGGGGGGKVLQVVFGSYSTDTGNSTSTFADTGLSASITPTLNTSKVLVIVNQQGVIKFSGNTNNAVKLNLLRGATTILKMGDDNADTGTSIINSIGSVSASYLDEPATTSSITYKTQFANRNNGAQVNVQYYYGDVGAAVSTITLLEIGA